MNLSLGGGTARLGAVAATVVLSFSLVACSGSDEPEPLKTTASAKPTPDKAAVDKADVTALTKNFWAAVVNSENTGSTDATPFEGLADPGVIEIQLTTVREYQDIDLLRVGEPAITDIDVTVSGDTATIVLCLNEDDWRTEVDGKPLAAEKLGNRPWAAKAERVDGSWIVQETGLEDKGTKKCP